VLWLARTSRIPLPGDMQTSTGAKSPR